MCAGFASERSAAPQPANAHHLVNRGDEDAVFLEVGSRSPGDSVHYPDDDIRAALDADGAWVFTHKDGTPY